MKGRAFAAVVLSALLLLSGLGIGGWWLLWQRGPLQLAHHPLTMPRAARFVPASASFSLYLFSDGQRPVDYARAVAPARQRRPAGEAIARLRDGAFAAAGLDYQDELAGWLGGDIAMALFEDPVAAAEGGAAEQPARGWLLALASRDDDGARRFLQRFWQTRSLAGTDLQVSRYRGMGLISGRGALLGSRPEPLATALVDDDLVLIGSGRNLIERALDVSQIPELNQAGQPLLQQGVAAYASGAALAVASPQALQSWLGLPALEELTAVPLAAPPAAAAAAPAASPPPSAPKAAAAAASSVSSQGRDTAAGAAAQVGEVAAPASARGAPSPARSPMDSAPGGREEARDSEPGDRAVGPGRAPINAASGAARSDLPSVVAPAASPAGSGREPAATAAGAEPSGSESGSKPALAGEASPEPPVVRPDSVAQQPVELPLAAAPGAAASGAPATPAPAPSGSGVGAAGSQEAAPTGSSPGSSASAAGSSAGRSAAAAGENRNGAEPDQPAAESSQAAPRRPAAVSVPGDRSGQVSQSRRLPWAAQPAIALAPAAAPQPAPAAASLLAVLQPQGRQLELRARLLLPRAPHLTEAQPELNETLLAALRGSPSSLALIQDPATLSQEPLLRPLLERGLGLRTQAAAERQGPLPALLVRSIRGPLLASQAVEGWQLASQAGDPAAKDLEPLLRQAGLLEAPLELDGHSLRVWTRLSLPSRSGRRDRGDALVAPLVGWSERLENVAWWGQTLAALEAPADSRTLTALRRALRELALPQAPLQWSLDADGARALLRSWQPWRLLSALAGGGLDAPVQGLALALESPPDVSALELRARLRLGA